MKFRTFFYWFEVVFFLSLGGFFAQGEPTFVSVLGLGLVPVMIWLETVCHRDYVRNYYKGVRQ